MNFLEIAALFWSLPWLCGENMVASSDDPASSHDSPLSEPCHGDACRYIKILHLPAQKQSHPTIRSARSLIDSRASPRQDDIVCALISTRNAFARGRRGRGSRSVRKVTVRCFPEPVFTNHRQKGEGGGERWWSKKGMMRRKGEREKKNWEDPMKTKWACAFAGPATAGAWKSDPIGRTISLCLPYLPTDPAFQLLPTGWFMGCESSR